jgi:hypothetical protein
MELRMLEPEEGVPSGIVVAAPGLIDELLALVLGPS